MSERVHGGDPSTPRATTRTTLIGNPAVAQRLLDVNIRLRARSADEFLARYSPFVEDDRIFIFTRAAPPVGTRLRFALRLAKGEVLLRGRGVVRRVNVDGDRPGMELLFVPADDSSAHFLERVRRRRAFEMPAHDGAPVSTSSPVLPALPPTSLSWPVVRTPPPAGEPDFELPVDVELPA